MIDQNLLLLSVFPLAMIGLAVWGVYLNRVNPGQAAEAGEEPARVLDEAKSNMELLDELEERIGRLEEELQQHRIVIVRKTVVRGVRTPNSRARMHLRDSVA